MNYNMTRGMGAARGALGVAKNLWSGRSAVQTGVGTVGRDVPLTSAQGAHQA